MNNKITKTDIDTYNNIYVFIWKRCKEIAEYYYNSGLYKRGIHYISGFDIYDNKITIFEQSHGQDLEFDMDDFIDDKKLKIAIKNDIIDYLNDY